MYLSPLHNYADPETNQERFGERAKQEIERLDAIFGEQWISDTWDSCLGRHIRRRRDISPKLVGNTSLFTAYVVVTLLAVVAIGFSGIVAMLHFRPILPGMIKAGVPESWLTFPIGTLKTAGAIGLLLGVIGIPMIGTAAAIGLILFFICAVYTHMRAGDYSFQFGLAIGYLLLAMAALVLDIGTAGVTIHDHLR